MDDETRAYFEEMRRRFDAMDRRFDATDQRFDASDQRFDAMDRRFDAMDQRFDASDQRFDASDQRFDASDAKLDAYRREAGVTAEHLLDEIKLVAEVARSNGQAIERLRDEMNTRFRENEIVLRAAFGQIRSDIEELRDRR
jgi:hypothetical protein